VSHVIETRSEEETSAVGERFAQTLSPGAVVLLYGELGAGKTAFVRGMARGLGASADDVSSPTFTLIQEYRTPRLALHHVDLYRLQPAEVDDLGLEELTESGDIVAIEWAERWLRRPADAIEVRIEELGTERRAIVTSAGHRGATKSEDDDAIVS
jgi:tRNA threonylcarbamoyladenosine biosynthesis protein TsaE